MRDFHPLTLKEVLDVTPKAQLTCKIAISEPKHLGTYSRVRGVFSPRFFLAKKLDVPTGTFLKVNLTNLSPGT